MSATQRKLLNIVIAGDVTMDWNLARAGSAENQISLWNPVKCTTASWQRGGAALLADLASALGQKIQGNEFPEISFFHGDYPEHAVVPGDPHYHHSYAIWSSFKNRGKDSWRVVEFLGIDHCSSEHLAEKINWLQVVGEPEEVHLLVLDDADLGFRDQEQFWPKCLKNQATRPWILLKMSQPVASGPLWELLVDKFSDRLIVLTTVNDLRLTDVQISQGLSWERTAQDVIWELDFSQKIKSLSRCAGVIVSFNAAGAVVYLRFPAADKEAGTTDVRKLVFDPKVMEGMWEAMYPGGVIGYSTCLIGGIIQQLILSMDQADIIRGVQAGLGALRDLHIEGYASSSGNGQSRLSFPLQRVAEQITKPVYQFSVTDIQDPARFLNIVPSSKERAPSGGYWTILEDHYQKNLVEVCEQIVLQGAEKTLQEVPQGVFGALFTVDRQEIEGFRSVRALAAEYLSQENQKRPLSIAVFGPPGSGKSFGIAQVANSLAPGRIKVLEFNLSQYETIDKLVDALHQVRDVNLSGSFPLVFWDEFDSPLSGKPLGWLRYFLAPMQDGAFREGQIVHPIGPAIFVFAGGTSARMEEFGQGLSPQDSRSAKVPDFISRLKGFVNILGPNRQTTPTGDPGSSDPYFVIRRAILLRSILWRNARHLFEGDGRLNIDRGALRAFLNTGVYKHGVRSMESIITMSQLAGKNKFERSSLPPKAQLDLHVDGQEFLGLVQQIELTPELLDQLAVLFHEDFCTLMKNQGYQYGKVTDDKARTHSSLVDFNKLPEDEIEQNRDAVRDIHRKLSASGYIMIPARSNQLSFEFPGSFMQDLAQMEHERWMQSKISSGWKYAPETDKPNKLHAALVDWNILDENDQLKDMEMVRIIPNILAKAGYTVVKLSA